MFANLKSHNWVWHYSTLIPKPVQTKSQAAASQGPDGQTTSITSATLLDEHDTFLEQQLSTKEKLKETIELIKSSNKSMSQMAMNMFFK